MDYIKLSPEWVSDEILDLINDGIVLRRRIPETDEQYLLFPKVVPVPIEYFLEDEYIFIPEE